MTTLPPPLAPTTAPAPAPPAGPAIAVERISKTYYATRALHEVSLAVAPGSVHALLGGNGSGKSTLIKVLAGVVRAAPGGLVRRPSPGGGDRSVETEHLTPAVSRGLGLRFVHQDPALFDDLSVADNLSLGSGFPTGVGGRVRRRAQRRSTEAVLERFGVQADPGAPLSSLRPAQRTMLAVARALHDGSPDEPRVLVLDEPTATLPRHEVAQLLAGLRAVTAEGHAVVLVSHRLEEVVDVADAFTVLRDGRHVLTERLSGQTAAHLAEAIVGRRVERLGASAAPAGPAAQGLRVEGVAAGRLRDVSLSVAGGEVVGIAGLGGSGCSRLLRTVAGDLRPGAGAVLVGGRPLPPGDIAAARRAGVRFVPELRSMISLPDMTVGQNLTGVGARRYWRLGRMSRRAEREEAERDMARFGIVAASPDVGLSALSGGNQQKVVLAAALRDRPGVLLLDEPTQGVDIGARLEIHRLIRAAADQGTAVLVASSDLDELAMLCQRVEVVADGVVTATLAGPDLTEHRLLREIQGDP